MARKRILVISFSDLARDPRVARQLQVLAEDYEVIAAGTAPPRDLDVEFVQLGNYYAPVGAWTVKRAAFLLLRRFERAHWSHPALRAAKQSLAEVRPDLVLANDLTALPLALSLGPPVVYDAHEYSPREYEDSRWWRLMWQPYAETMCRRYMPQAAATITVGEAIADRYEQDIGVRPAVVLNAPPYAELEPTPVHEPIRMLHTGWADPSRKLESMIEVVKHLDDRYTLDFVLMEDRVGNLPELKELAEGDERIRFLPPVPMQDLVTFANDYDIGIYLLDPGAFNRRYALPNKFFEFIQARLCVAIGPSPEMAGVVREWRCGVVAPDFEPASLAGAIAALSRDALRARKTAASTAARHLSAQHQATVLRQVVLGATAVRSAGSREASRPSTRP